MTEVGLRHHTGGQVLAMLADIADLYIAAHSGNPGESDELFSRPSFVTRTSEQAREPGFDLVTATVDSTLVGFSFGYLFGPGRWWADCTPLPQDVLTSSKFAVIELDVRKDYRGQGLGRKLLEELLKGRPEQFATLAATPGSQAHWMYLRWGWHKANATGFRPK